MTRSRSWAHRAMLRLGRALRPLLHPSYEEDETRLRRLAAGVSESLSRLESQHEALTRLGTLVESEHEAARATARRFDEALTTERDRARAADRLIDRRLSRQWSAVARATKRQARIDGWQLEEVAVHERLARLSAERGSIIVGPWAGEIGFELIYWIPFVRWAVDKFALDPSRLVIVSRGGTSDWYGLPSARYIDVLSLVDVDTYRAGTSAQLKQRQISTFDRRLVREVSSQLGERARVLHPGLMYQLFYPAWKLQTPMSRIAEYSRFAPIASSLTAGALRAWPAPYVAVRFYFSKCFPDSAGNRAFVLDVVRALTDHLDVVWLSPGARVDDHAEFRPPASPRLHVYQAVDASRNLADQTAVIAGAEAFVGTYGGFSYLAPFCGVDTVGWYSEANFLRLHLHRAEEGLTAAGGGRLLAVDVASRPLLARLGPSLADGLVATSNTPDG